MPEHKPNSPIASNPRRAVFLDRDGVINHDSGYLWRIQDFVFKEGIFEFCRTAISHGYLLIVVTNQAGIGRGYYTEHDFHRLTQWMRKRFEREGAPLTAVYYCPYHPQHGLGAYKHDSFDRKPNPGMLIRAALDYGISLADSVMVGDKETDMQAGFNAGIARRYLLGMPYAESGKPFGTQVVRSLRELSDCFILEHGRRRSPS